MPDSPDPPPEGIEGGLDDVVAADLAAEIELLESIKKVRPEARNVDPETATVLRSWLGDNLGP